MNNLIRSMEVILKTKKKYLMFLIIAVIVVCGGIFKVEGLDITGLQGITVNYLASVSVYTITSSGLFIISVLCQSYTSRIQMYEIMAGYSPNQIIFGRIVFCLKYLFGIYLLPITLLCFVTNPSQEMAQMLFLHWMLCIRFSLVCVCVSPILKKEVVICIFSVMIVAFTGEMSGDTNSLITWFGFVQALILPGEFTNSFVVKVMVSTIVTIAGAYGIGYITLKKKIGLYLLNS